jgi:hypothetical protein
MSDLKWNESVYITKCLPIESLCKENVGIIGAEKHENSADNHMLIYLV